MLTLSRGEWRLPPRSTFVIVFGDCRDMALAAGTALNTNKQTNKQAVYGGRKSPASEMLHDISLEGRVAGSGHTPPTLVS